MDLGLAGKVAVITGGGGGIGRCMVRAFADEGARLVVGDVSAAVAADSVADAQEHGAQAIAVTCDVSAPSEVNELMAKAHEHFGQLDILINNAGILQTQRISELTQDQWRRLLDINLIGTFLCAQAALRLMKPRRTGCIVNLGSMAGQIGGIQSGASYAASKAGVIALTKSLANDAGTLGIRVNCINPGTIDTPMNAGWGEEAYERLRQRTPLGRLGRPEEIANVALFLCSPLASFIHGTHIDVNGGLYMD